MGKPGAKKRTWQILSLAKVRVWLTFTLPKYLPRGKRLLIPANKQTTLGADIFVSQSYAGTMKKRELPLIRGRMEVVRAGKILFLPDTNPNVSPNPGFYAHLPD